MTPAFLLCAWLSFTAPYWKAPACDSTAGAITHADVPKVVVQFRGQTNLWQAGYIACLQNLSNPYLHVTYTSDVCWCHWWPQIKAEADYRWTREKPITPGAPDSLAVPESGHYGLRATWADARVCLRDSLWSCPKGVGLP